MREGLACRCGRGTLYDVLQVSPWCEPEVIQAAFRALARTRHPDVNRDPDAEEQMRRLNAAYQTLSDPSRRARYDEELALEAARPMVPARPASAPAAAPSAPSSPWASAGSASNGYAGRNGATGPRPAPGPRPAASAPSAVGATVSAAPSPTYQTTIFDTRGEMLFPRSAVYASLVIVTVIVALVAWLVLDTLAQRPNVPSRLPPPRGYQEQQAGPALAFAERFELAGASVEPGLSLTVGRWNQ